MDLDQVDRIIDQYDCEKSWLVMILQDIQEVYHYLPGPALQRVAERLSLGDGHVCNVATFYSSFSLTERGKYVLRLCDGTACHLRGAVNVRDEITRQLGITEGETTGDKQFTLEIVACLGACALAPVMAIGSQCHGQMNTEKLKRTLGDCQHEGPAQNSG